VEEEEEEKGSIEEVVTLPDEGELLLVKRVLFGFQWIEEEPLKRTVSHPKRKGHYLYPHSPL